MNDLNKEITDIFDKACDETVKILAESNISRISSGKNGGINNSDLDIANAIESKSNQ